MYNGLQGFGKGEISAGMSNWRSLPNIGAPLLYAAVYPLRSQESSVPHGQILTHPTYFLPMFMLRRQLHGMAQCVFVVDRSRYNWGAQNGFPKALFLSRMLLGAVLPELTFRMISAKERKRLSTSS